MKNVDILDCTLRDGSYVIDYQFTAEDTYIISLGLANAGFKLIEIGHGTGMGSSDKNLGKAATSDREYLLAAKSALKDSSSLFGMFFIPGIGTISDLVLGAECGMGFVRIGVDVTDVDRAEPYIRKAKELGLLTSVNLMKSYAVDFDQFAEYGKKADVFGADIISVVDSAGGMFPEDVKGYIDSLKRVTDKRIGFHGHNNLQLAIINSLVAVEAGASIVDASLQGMGRSAGNTQTEILAMALEHKGYTASVDILKTLDLGKKVIAPLMTTQKGVDDISVVSGISLFHSSYYKMIHESANQFNIDERSLIIKVSEKEKVKLTKELVDLTAREIMALNDEKTEVEIKPFIIEFENNSPSKLLANLIETLFTLSRKTGKETAITFTINDGTGSKFPFIKQKSSYIIGNVEATNIEELKVFLIYCDGKCDWILLDESNVTIDLQELSSLMESSKCLGYSEKRAVRLAVSTLISQKFNGGAVLILSDSEDLRQLSGNLARVKLFTPDSINSDNDFKELNAIVSFGCEFSGILDKSKCLLFSPNIEIFTISPNGFNKDFWDASVEAGFNLLRLHNEIGLNVEVTLCVDSYKQQSKTGSLNIGVVPMVAGGVIGERGAVIVDSIETPQRIIGIADGMGGLLDSSDEREFSTNKEQILSMLVKSVYK